MNLQGKIIIAPPAVKNNFWHKTAVLITEHHSQGASGVVLNKRSQMSLPEFGNQLGIPLDLPGFVYLGGPVNVKNLTFLHTNDWVCKNTLRINDQISISSADDILPRLSAGDRPERWRLFLGLSGWGPGQLENEIQGVPPFHHTFSWLYTNCDLDLVFGCDHNDQWNSFIDRAGQEFAQTLFA